MKTDQNKQRTIKNNGCLEMKVVCPSCQQATLLYPQGYLPKLESILPKNKTEKDFSTYSYNTTYATMEGYNQAIADCTKALMDSKVFAMSNPRRWREWMEFWREISPKAHLYEGRMLGRFIDEQIRKIIGKNVLSREVGKNGKYVE